MNTSKSLFTFLQRKGSTLCTTKVLSNIGVQSNMTHQGMIPTVRGFSNNKILFKRRRRDEDDEEGTVNWLKEEDKDQIEPLRISGVLFPPEFEHYLTDPYGKKNRRDAIHEKKVERLQNIHKQAKMPKARREKEVQKETVRQQRISQLLCNELQHAIGKVRGLPTDVQTLFTKSKPLIDRVEVTRDIRKAKIYWSTAVSALQPLVEEELKKPSVVSYIRTQLAQRTSFLKYSPELTFLQDEQNRRIEEQQKMENLLNTIEQRQLCAAQREEEAQREPVRRGGIPPPMRFSRVIKSVKEEEE